ncbi:MAG TPA: hypothetical protein VHV30_15070, partial [Polyangiaceae bacterium]|nr:hypothetical protein [Polyangiaceae bacterium]
MTTVPLAGFGALAHAYALVLAALPGTAAATAASAPPSAPAFSYLTTFLAFLKPLLPVPLLCLVLPALWWFFRDTWRELDDDATQHRLAMADAGRTDLRPFVALVMCAVILT